MVALVLILGLTLGSTAQADNSPKQHSTQSILVLGDSLSAGYGMDLEQSWVHLLGARLAQQQLAISVINGSISGDTTAGGLRRLPGLLARHAPKIVLIELGGNDGLRGYPLGQMRSNLEQMTQLAQDSGAQVLLLAVEVPPNLGGRYTSQFRDSFPLVAESMGAQVTPFILEGIATQSELMQPDGIHPTADAQLAILDNVWPHLEPMLATLFVAGGS